MSDMITAEAAGKLLDSVKADREVGTEDHWWHSQICDFYLSDDFGAYDDQKACDKRRILRVPALERTVIAIHADRDRLAAANAALEAQVARLVEVGQKLFLAARELRDYASYAEIVGGVSVNRPQIRKWCDTIAEIVNTLPDDENYERSFAALAAVQADARRDGEGGE